MQRAVILRSMAMWRAQRQRRRTQGHRLGEPIPGIARLSCVENGLDAINIFARFCPAELESALS